MTAIHLQRRPVHEPSTMLPFAVRGLLGALAVAREAVSLRCFVALGLPFFPHSETPPLLRLCGTVWVPSRAHPFTQTCFGSSSHCDSREGTLQEQAAVKRKPAGFLRTGARCTWRKRKLGLELAEGVSSKRNWRKKEKEKCLLSSPSRGHFIHSRQAPAGLPAGLRPKEEGRKEEGRVDSLQSPCTVLPLVPTPS